MVRPEIRSGDAERAGAVRAAIPFSRRFRAVFLAGLVDHFHPRRQWPRLQQWSDAMGEQIARMSRAEARGDVADDERGADDVRVRRRDGRMAMRLDVVALCGAPPI